ncbi:MAG: helix-turn-helix transcriptional regulator [Solirubrobacterales bacterium]|nr:helix-turn-helix transcriptional regulator [Solirubrobacterales bacterium]MBV9717503.1 helix-turn-helix transcriptional regulator [Solirubrobacterales bacterium]
MRSKHLSPSSPSTAALFDLLGRRWALRVLWELRDAEASFQALHERCDSMSTSVLSQRLRELRAAGLVDAEKGGPYRLSEHGRVLLDQLRWVDEWTRTWSAALGGAIDTRETKPR